MRIVHVVVTDAFAGTERYVADVTAELEGRGHVVTVVGGAQQRMRRELSGDVDWRPGRNVLEASASLRALGRQDIVHAHMTFAEAAVLLARRVNRGRFIATRHFAADRGQSAAGKLFRIPIERALDTEVAISEFTASAGRRRPDVVIRNGVPCSDDLYNGGARAVTVAQRLEPEKGTALAVDAWARSGLADAGWEMLIAGEGKERSALEALVASAGVRGIQLVGRIEDMRSLWSRTAMLLATAPAEPLGLTVLEAMSAGIPVVASDAGGHRETVGSVLNAPMFAVGDAHGAARCMRELALDGETRRRLGKANRDWQRENATLVAHVDQLLRVYAR